MELLRSATRRAAADEVTREVLLQRSMTVSVIGLALALPSSLGYRQAGLVTHTVRPLCTAWLDKTAHYKCRIQAAHRTGLRVEAGVRAVCWQGLWRIRSRADLVEPSPQEAGQNHQVVVMDPDKVAVLTNNLCEALGEHHVGSDV